MTFRSKTILPLLCSLPLALAVSAAGAEEAKPELVPEFSAKTLDANLDSGVVTYNEATVTLGDGWLTGDAVDYDTRAKTLLARGRVALNFNSLRILAEEVEYSLVDRSFTVKAPRMGLYPLCVQGESATGDAKGISLRNVVASYGEPHAIIPSFVADSLRYDTDQQGSFKAEKARLGLGGFHFFPVPSFRQPVGESLTSFMTLQGGYRSSFGAFVEAGVRVPVRPGFRLGADFGVYTKRGFLFGPGLEYGFGKGGDKETIGSLRTGYINDHGQREDDILGNPVPEQRSFITWTHRQKFGDFDAEGLFSDWRDSEIMRDFRRSEFLRTQTPDSYLELGYNAPNWRASAFARFHPNPFHAAQERLPELRLDVMPVRLVEKVYQRLNLSYASLRDNPPGDVLPTLETDRLDAYYQLSRTFAPTDWAAATLIAGARSTWYSDTLDSSTSGGRTRNLGEFGFDAQLRTSGTFEVKSERWGIDGLRHLVIPRLSYRYVPQATKGADWIPAIDRRVYDTYLQPLGLGDVRHIDALGEMNTLRLGLEQRLQTRDATYGSRDLAVLTLANDILFDRPQGSRKVARTHLDLALMPASWLRLEAYSSFRPQTLGVHELNTAVALHDGDEWTFRFGSHYLENDLAELGVDFEKRLNENFSAYTRLLYDARESRMNEHAYGLLQTIDRIWNLRYEIAFYNGPRREGGVEFRLEVQARSF